MGTWRSADYALQLCLAFQVVVGCGGKATKYGPRGDSGAGGTSATGATSALGAPPALVAASQRAALDEVRHARIGFALASHYLQECVDGQSWLDQAMSESAARADLAPFGQLSLHQRRTCQVQAMARIVLPTTRQLLAAPSRHRTVFEPSHQPERRS